MAAHRYWRLTHMYTGYVASGTTYTTSFQLGMAETVWRATSGGSNVLSGGTISVSSQYDGTYTAGDLIDGSTGTDNEWVSAAQSTRQWIKYDFGAGNETDIEEVLVYARPWFNGQEPSLVIMQSSDDDSAWTPEWYATTGSAYSPGDIRTFTKPTGIVLTGGYRYWRLYVTAAGGGTTSFGDIYTRTGASAPDLSPLATVTASSSYPNDDHQPINAIDLVPEGGNGGDWGASDGSQPQWFAFDFGPGSAPNITHVGLKARTSFSQWTAAPREGSWQRSTDGSNWVTVSTFNESAWTSGEVRNLTLTPVDAFATLGATEPVDTLASSVDGVATATANVTPSADTLSSATTINVGAATARAEPLDTLAGVAVILVERFGAALRTEPVDALTAVGLTQKYGIASPVAPVDTISANAQTVVRVTATPAEPGDSLTGSGILASITASAAVTEPSPGFNADAFSGPGITGAGAAVDELSSAAGTTGVSVQASAIPTSPADTIVAAADVLVALAGVAAPTTDALSGVSAILVSGTGAVAELSDTTNSFVTVPVQTISAAVEPADTMLTSIHTEVKARAVVNEPTETVSATGVMTVTAALAALEPGETLSSQIIMPVAAALTVTEHVPSLGDADATVAIFSRVLDVVADARVRLSDIDLYFD